MANQTSSHTACYELPKASYCAPKTSSSTGLQGPKGDKGDPATLTPGSVPLSALAPGALPSGLSMPVGQLTGPGALTLGITIDGAQVTGQIPASALPSGPLPASTTIGASQIAGIIDPANLPKDILTYRLGAVSGTGPTATRDLILTLNGTDTNIPLAALTSGAGGKTLVGFIFPAI